MQENHEASRMAIPALFTHAGRTWRKRAKPLGTVILTVLVPVTLVNLIGGYLHQNVYADVAWLSMLLRYGSNLLLIVAWILVLLLAASSSGDGDEPMRDVFRLAGDRYIPGGLAFLASYAARAAGLTLIGVLATVLPGDSVLRSLLFLLGVPVCAVALMMWVSLAPFITVIDGRPVVAALRVSVRTVALHWRAVGGLLLLLTVLQGVVSLLVWFASSTIDSWAAQWALSAGYSFYGSSALRIVVLLPVRIIDDVTLLFALTVFTLYFMDRRAAWGIPAHDTADVDEETAVDYGTM